MIVDPVGYEQLLKIDNFVKYDATGQAGKSSNPIINGFVGMLFGIKVYKSTQVTKNGSFGLGLMWHKDFAALALQQDVKVDALFVPGRLGTELVVSNIYGYGVTRSTHAVAIQYGILG
jgi:hypothetical protein